MGSGSTPGNGPPHLRPRRHADRFEARPRACGQCDARALRSAAAGPRDRWELHWQWRPGPDPPRDVAEASQNDVDKALEYFLAYYGDHKLDNTRAYPGIPEALEALHQASVRMAVLTNKPVRISGRIIEGLGLSKYFLHVYGGNSFDRKKPDPLGVETLLAETGVSKHRALIVGDSAVDVQTARNAGVKVCGVTYGFQPASFVTDPPDMIVSRPEELARAVIAERKSGGVVKS